jgi:uncharacterized iron-regulated protein
MARMNSMRRSLARCTPALLLPVLAACSRATPVTAPVPLAGETANPAQRVVSAATGQNISFAQMAEAAARADVVFFGEMHDDDESHRAELALLTAIGERRDRVVLSLEMFERDVQPLLDAYLAGRMTEADFVAQSRPWPNYAADYRPLVELAKAKGWPVIAANVPRRLASGVSRRGLASVDSLPAADRAYVASDLQCPQDQYYRNFVAVMGGGHGGAGGAPGTAAAGARSMTDLFYESQCVKDETMAESIIRGRRDRAIVVHFNGAFHSDFGLGTVSRVVRRAPGVRTVVVSAVPSPAPDKEKVADHLAKGQFIIIALRTKP